MKTCACWVRRCTLSALAAALAALLAWPVALAGDATASARLFASSSDFALWSGDLAETNQPTRLPIEGKVVHFQIAPTSDRMLYVVMEEAQATGGSEGATRLIFKLFVSALDGSNAQLLTDLVDDPNVYYLQTIESRLQPMFWDTGGPLYPHWCSDGRRILFNGRRGDDGS